MARFLTEPLLFISKLKSITVKLSLSLPKLSKSHFLAVCFLALCCLFSCSKDEEIYQQNKQEAKIRFVNASKNSTNIDVYVDDLKLNSGALNYSQETSYQKIASGTKKASVKHDGQEDIQSDINFIPTFSYTSFFVINRDNKAELVTFEDNLGAPETGKAKIRFVNLGSHFTNSVNITLTGGVLLVNALEYKKASSYFSVDPEVNIRFSIVGTSASKVLSTDEIQPGKSYTIWLDGTSNADLTINKILYN